MPYFNSVGFIDDAVFTTPEAVTREYRRRYSLAAYHERRAELVTLISPKSVCCECERTLPPMFLRSSPTLTFTWSNDKAKAKATALGVSRANALVTAGKDIVEAMVKAKLVEVLCDDHAKRKLWGKGLFTHGTYWGAYRHKCQCDECLEYRADHILRRREDRRYKKMAGVEESAAASAAASAAGEAT